jgi:hypothetical protein
MVSIQCYLGGGTVGVFCPGASGENVSRRPQDAATFHVE